MKTWLAIILFGLLTTQYVKGQYVTIPDQNFVIWMANNGLSQCINGLQLDTTCAELLNDTIVDCRASLIHNLYGIQFFKNLHVLICDDNILDSLPYLPNSLHQLFAAETHITFLPKLPDSLIYLECSSNTSLTFLPALPATLKILSCRTDSLTRLPLLPGHLDSLDCQNNYLTSLPDLPSSLTYLNCNQNLIDTIPSADSLIWLSCQYNNLHVIKSISNTLIYLNCYSNHLTKLPPLPPVLQTLQCDENQIDTIPLLPKTLLSLYANGNQLRWVTPPLPDSLQCFGVDANMLTTVPAIPSTVTSLGLSFNQLSELPSILPDSMQSFGCDSNVNIRCMPKFKRIVYFSFTNTAITCLPDYGDVSISWPPLNTVPLCDSGNINGCAYSGINQPNSISNLLILYPNPATTTCTVKINEPAKISSAIITDALGRQVMPLFSNQQLSTFQFNSSTLSTGLYFVVIKDEQGNLGVLKLVKQ